MRLRTALCVAAAGVSLACWHARRHPRLGRVLAAAVAALGLVTFGTYVTEGWALGHDALYGGVTLAELAAPGRFTLPTSLICTCLGAALVALHRGARARFVEAGALAALVLSLLALIGHLYHADELMTPLSGRAIALVRSLLLAATACGILIARPDRGLVRLVASDDPGGLMVRGLLGPLVLVPILAGHLSLLGWKRGLYDEAMAMALVVVVTAGSAAVLLLWHAEQLAALYRRYQLARENLVSAQRIDAAGYLAGWICHELNNLLTVIKGNAELLVLEAPHDADGARDLLAACDECAELSRKLLRFSGHEMAAREEVDLVAVVEELRPTVESIAGPGIRVHISVPERARVKAGRAQLRHALLQPILNARDAMPAGGDLTLEVESASDAVTVQISDTGGGMDPITRARACEPFFTTKDRSRGTGLGLATVHGIVKQLGGTLTIRSAPDKGTVVTLTFPAP